MKRILLLVSWLGFLGFLMAAPPAGNKVNWCHYPPGQVDRRPQVVHRMSSSSKHRCIC